MSLRDAIAAAVRQVGEHGDYIVSTNEMRTRYAVIDPILEALGWDIANPSQVKVEYGVEVSGQMKRVDYALFSNGKPVILVEAKKLSPAQVDSWKKIQAKERRRLLDDWGSFKRGERLSETEGIRDDDFWQPALTQSHISQLRRYVNGLGLTDGYAVLTNGAEWIVYDLSISGKGPRFTKKAESKVNILSLHSLDECVKALGVLRRRRKK